MNVLMIGCGKMGGALLKNWKDGGENFTIVDPGLSEAPAGVTLHADKAALKGRTFDVVVVAIKPQMVDDILPDYADAITADGYVLSIAAGCSITRLKAASGGSPVIRVMPNLPAAIGAGVSGLCASEDASKTQLAHAREMMERAGTVIAVADEDELDRVTAVAGSGPGYVFELARAYVEAARTIGFAERDATAMVIQTMIGTLEMAQSSEMSLEELRNSVTSKNGTTAAGLDALNGDGQMSELLEKTLGAAYARAVELR
ncbi:MAG: pyrroline-5-carboxylate reductase [Erythrobacter sp.]|uniref:pyrroline-5-carboxylate reductase family protein n=1 Tax=Erythrobacter sp. TaxID=1042 RepID=UPI003C777CDC